MSTTYDQTNYQITKKSASTSTRSTTSTIPSSSCTPEDNSSELDWDLKLNKLLEDLQKSVPLLTSSVDTTNRNVGTLSEYTEYRTPISSPMLQRANNQDNKSSSKKQIIFGHTNVNQSSVPFYLTPNYSNEKNSLSLQKNRKLHSIIENDSRDISNTRSRNTSSEYDDSFYSTANQSSQMQFIDASNTVTILKSEESSPIPPPAQLEYSNITQQIISPKIERKEYYSSNTSYNKNAITGTGRQNKSTVTLDDDKNNDIFEFVRPQNYPISSHQIISSKETMNSPVTVKYDNNHQIDTNYYPIQIGQPLYSSTPKPSISNNNIIVPNTSSNSNGGGVYPIKSPQQNKKILLQRNESYKTSCKSTNYDNDDDDDTIMDNYNYSNDHNSSMQRINNNRIVLDMLGTQNPPAQKFYTATIIRTETKEIGRNPIVRIFSTRNGNTNDNKQNKQNDRIDDQPPKKLNDLLATFDESFIETSKIVGDGGGPHKSHPYGPGTYPKQRSVRIDESANIEKEIIEKYTTELSSTKTTTNNNNHNNNNNNNNIIETCPTTNTTGPPVFYPIHENELLFPITNNESLLQQSKIQGKGKSKSKIEKNYKQKENYKQKHTEKSNGGTLPVPVCLPVCCAAPCVIL